MGEEIALENGRISDFHGLVSRDLDLDLGSGHGHYLFSSLIEYYLYTKFHRNRRNFLWTDGRTDGNLTPILLGRFPKFGSRPKNTEFVYHYHSPAAFKDRASSSSAWWWRTDACRRQRLRQLNSPNDVLVVLVTVSVTDSLVNSDDSPADGVSTTNCSSKPPVTSAACALTETVEHQSVFELWEKDWFSFKPISPLLSRQDNKLIVTYEPQNATKCVISIS